MNLFLGVFIFLLFFLGVPKPVSAGEVVINEFVANPHTGEDEWVEFYNPNAIDISSYWIDDDTNFSEDTGNASKKQLTTIDTSSQNFPFYNLTVSFFNNTCDESTGCDYVVLFSQEGLIIDQFQYSSEQIAQKGKSIGRSPDGSDSWTILETTTKGNSNSPPQSTPTPTPTNTPTPTKIPTPTKTPTPTKVPTPTKTPPPTKVPTPAPTPKSPTPTLIKSEPTIKPTATIFPTGVLGESTKSAKAEPSETKKFAAEKNLVKEKDNNSGDSSSSSSILPAIFLLLGVVFILTCGILGFWKYRKTKDLENNE